ncbi:MAG: GNAT family N-acetyltransferase [Eubacteriales bacterium]|nr:GNAT family N-acetyltransferase [Eubacteriales bacterium]
MAMIEISKLSGEMNNSFDCGNNSINALIVESYYATILQHAYGYTAIVNGQVVGIYMLKFMKIVLEQGPECLSDYKSDICNDCFSVHIKYIAVQVGEQGKGLGRLILKYIITEVMKLCQNWPVRLITLDALKEKYEWYRSIGFVAFNEEDQKDNDSTIKMYLDCLLDKELVDSYVSGCLDNI